VRVAAAAVLGLFAQISANTQEYPMHVLIRSLPLAAGALALLATSGLAHSATRTLTIYTYESFVAEWGPGPAIETAFEATCGDCDIEFIALDSSAGILNRVQLEGASTNADVVLGLDTNLMAIAEDTGLLAASGVDTSGLSLPIEWTSETFVPYDYGYFAFVYDTEKLSTPPTSLAELVADPDGPKIILQDPRTSTPGLGFLLWMKSVFGDEAGERWVDLQPRILATTKGWSEAYFTMFLNEEAPLVLSYSTSPAYHIEVDGTERYQAAAFDEGHYLQVEVAARLAASDEPELAEEFLAFLISPEAQSSIPLGNVMYPVVDLGDELPEAFSRLIEPAKTLLFDPAEVRDQRKAWVDEWLEASTR
jgi:thiamine transport system substrate-binding protein